ncbi:50S ribosomal protein L15 [Rubinisphaera italica]|uniref:50S ribosomal protein L15 n=2 Tax=Rubinisphaera italica TaxID=2527969 RepID=A0A5C5XMK0_9PLAN|nr:50S ribosomal protein L15 [Rubinisphaera italica]
MRVAKRGFSNAAFTKEVSILNIRDLEGNFNSGEEVTPESLEHKNLIGKKLNNVKILGDGELTKSLQVNAHKFSASAVRKIENAGGSIFIINEFKNAELDKSSSNNSLRFQLMEDDLMHEKVLLNESESHTWKLPKNGEIVLQASVWKLKHRLSLSWKSDSTNCEQKFDSTILEFLQSDNSTKREITEKQTNTRIRMYESEMGDFYLTIPNGNKISHAYATTNIDNDLAMKAITSRLLKELPPVNITLAVKIEIQQFLNNA